MAKHAAANQQVFFANNSITPQYSQKDNKQHTNASEYLRSIFLHDKPNDVIVFLQDVEQALASHPGLSTIEEAGQQPNEKIVSDIIASISFQHDIPLKTARTLYQRARVFSVDGRLLPGLPKGQRNNHILHNAIERAYKLSIEKPEALAHFVQIYRDRHIASKSCIKFGKKEKFEDLLQAFVEVGCQLIAPQHWKISGKNKDTVRALKRKLNLDAKIKTGENPHLDWYEVCVVAKKHKHSDKTKVKTKQYDSSTGVLKFLGWFLVVNVDYEK